MQAFPASAENESSSNLLSDIPSQKFATSSWFQWIGLILAMELSILLARPSAKPQAQLGPARIRSCKHYKWTKPTHEIVAFGKRFCQKTQQTICSGS